MLEQNLRYYFSSKKDLAATVIYYYRYFMPVMVMLVVATSSSLTFRIEAAIASIIYTVYLYTIEKSGYRVKYKTFSHRFIRLNFDLIYIAIICILTSQYISSARLFFLIPLFSAVNYKVDPKYKTCIATTVVYFFCYEVVSNIALLKSGQILQTGIDVFMFSTIICLFGFFLSIFDEKRKKVDEEAQKIRTIYKEVRISGNYQTNLEKLIKQLYEAIKADVITLHFLDNSTTELFVLKKYSPHKRVNYVMRQNISEGIVGKCYREKRKVLLDDLADNKDYLKIGLPIKSCYVLPILSNNNVIAILNLESVQKDFFGDPYEVNDEKKNHEIIDFIYDHCASIIKNSYEIHDSTLRLKKLINDYRDVALYLKSITHEIKNNLDKLIDLPDYLNNTSLPDWDVKLIKKGSSHSLKTIQEFSKLLRKATESKDLFNVNLKEIKIEDFMKRVENAIFYRSAQYSVNIKYQNNDNTNGIIIETDPYYLESIITNILINAIEAYNRRREDLDKKKKGPKEGQPDECNIIFETYLEKESDSYFLVFSISDEADGLDRDIVKNMNNKSVLHINERSGLNQIKRNCLQLNCSLFYKNIDKGTNVILKIPIK